MNDEKLNEDLNEYIMQKTIINMYKQGYSVNFIVKKYYKYKNKNSKPVKFEGVLLFPAKIYTMEYCRMYVTEVIYKYHTNNYNREIINF